MDGLVYYYTNCITSDGVLRKAKITPTDELTDIIKESQREWDNLPCDEDGATLEQDKAMTKHLNDVADRIIDTIRK